jgi:oxidoreductase
MVTARGGRSGIQVAVVGLGWAARTIWLPLLSEHPAFRVAAVADPDPAALAYAAAAGGRVFADASELSADDVDLAVVAVPNRLHASIAATLLGNGISVFLEKPVCLSSSEAELLADAERRGGAVLLAGSAARYRSDIKTLTGLMSSLGPVRHLELSWIRARGIPEGAGWFTHRGQAGGGALIDLGWHLLDVGFLLLGSPAVRDVLGAMSSDFLSQPAWRAAWRGDELAEPGVAPGSPDSSAANGGGVRGVVPPGQPGGGVRGVVLPGQPGGGVRGVVPPGQLGPAGGDVEDAARALLVTDGGVSVSLRASWASHRASDLTQVVVDGQEGTACLDCTFGFSPNRLPHPVLTLYRQGRREQVPLPADPVGAEYGRQVDALPGLLADPRMRGRAIAEAARTVEVIERLYQAAPRQAQARPSLIASRPPRRQGTGPDAPVASALPVPVVAAFAEVRELRSALADAAGGQSFVLHGRIPAGQAQFARSWPRIAAAVRLAMLGAVGLSYGTGRRVVTLLQLDDLGQIDATERYFRMLSLARLLREAPDDCDEIAKAERRLAKLSRPPAEDGLGLGGAFPPASAAGGSGGASPRASTAVLTQLRHAIGLMRAYSGQTESISRSLRAATYLAATLDGQTGDDLLQRNPHDGQVYGTFAHAMTLDDRPALVPSMVANPVLLRLPNVAASPAAVARLCGHLDPRRLDGRLLIAISDEDVTDMALLHAQAAAVHRAGHRPGWVYDCGGTRRVVPPGQHCQAPGQQPGTSPDRLRAVIDTLARHDIPIAGISVPITGRHLEYVAGIAGVLSGQPQPVPIPDGVAAGLARGA